MNRFVSEIENQHPRQTIRTIASDRGEFVNRNPGHSKDVTHLVTEMRNLRCLGGQSRRD